MKGRLEVNLAQLERCCVTSDSLTKRLRTFKALCVRNLPAALHVHHLALFCPALRARRGTRGRA